MNTSSDRDRDRLQRPGLNLVRGIGFALLCGTIGFLAPILMGLAFTFCRWRVFGFNAFDRALDLRSLPENLAYAAVGAAILFAAAGWASYAPNGTYRFARTLVTVFAISVPSWFVLGNACSALGLLPDHFRGEVRPLVELADVLMLSIAPVVTALVLSIM
jgi:hypothetical protein